MNEIIFSYSFDNCALLIALALVAIVADAAFSLGS